MVPKKFIFLTDKKKVRMVLPCCRFWYEERAGGLTDAQLQSVRRSSLARVLCDNAGVETVQPLAFLTPTVTNRRVSCDSGDIPNIDLNLWAEQ